MNFLHKWKLFPTIFLWLTTVYAQAIPLSHTLLDISHVNYLPCVGTYQYPQGPFLALCYKQFLRRVNKSNNGQCLQMWYMQVVWHFVGHLPAPHKHVFYSPFLSVTHRIGNVPHCIFWSQSTTLELNVTHNSDLMWVRRWKQELFPWDLSNPGISDVFPFFYSLYNLPYTVFSVGPAVYHIQKSLLE